MCMIAKRDRSGEFFVTIRDKDGNIKKRINVHNQLTTAGQEIYAKLLANTLTPSSNTMHIAHFELGTDNTPADKSDTALGASVWSKQATALRRSGTDVLSSCSVGSDELDGVTIQEVGVFLQDGTMWARAVLPAIDKNENMILDIERIDRVIY